MQSRAGTQPFLKAYNDVRAHRDERRAARKRFRAVEAVMDPAAAAAKKIRRNQAKRYVAAAFLCGCACVPQATSPSRLVLQEPKTSQDRGATQGGWPCEGKARSAKRRHHVGVTSVCVWSPQLVTTMKKRCCFALLPIDHDHMRTCANLYTHEYE